MGLFLVAAVPTLIHWIRSSVQHSAARIIAVPLIVLFSYVFIERHAGGCIDAQDWWALLGIMMGHRLDIEPAQNSESRH